MNELRVAAGWMILGEIVWTSPCMAEDRDSSKFYTPNKRDNGSPVEKQAVIGKMTAWILPLWTSRRNVFAECSEQSLLDTT